MSKILGADDALHLTLKVSFVKADGSEVASMMVTDWEMEKHLTEFEAVQGWKERRESGRVTITGRIFGPQSE